MGPQREMNALVHVTKRTWQYSELEDPFDHAGGNDVLKQGQAEHEDENQEPQEQDPTTYRPSQCKKILGSLARRLGPRDHSSKIGQPFLWSVPLARFGQVALGLRRRLRDQSWYPQNKNPNPKKKKPKEQLSGDCTTGLGPNRNGENQRGSSAETARLVLVPTETENTQQQLTGDCSTSFGHSTQREDSQPLRRHG